MCKSRALTARGAANAQDDDNLREALRYSAAMLGELRTSLLTPQKYFELYMQAFDELRHLEARPSRPLCLQPVQAGCAVTPRKSEDGAWS